jgi:hypothetical protein
MRSGETNFQARETFIHLVKSIRAPAAGAEASSKIFHATHPAKYGIYPI